MTPNHFELCDKVLRNLAARGERGAAWLADLPAQVEDLTRRWDITVGETFPNSTEAYVARAVTREGQLAVLKISIPGVEKADREVRVLQTADGSGFVRLLRHDPATGAMLLERLGSQLAQAGLAIEAQMAIVCTTLRKMWRVPARGLTLMNGAQKAERLATDIKRVVEDFPDACSAHTVSVALGFARQRQAAFEPETSVLGHGDAHAWNTLRDSRSGGYKFVDPEGNFIEPAHDVSISMREWPNDLLAGDPVLLGRKRCALLSRLTDVDEQAIWQWGLIEQLVNGLLYKEVGSDSDAAPFLSVAEAWANAEPR